MLVISLVNKHIKCRTSKNLISFGKKGNWKCPCMLGDHSLYVLKEPHSTEYPKLVSFILWYTNVCHRKVLWIMFTAKDHIQWYSTISLHIQRQQHAPPAPGGDYWKKWLGTFSKHPLHPQPFFYFRISLQKWYKQRLSLFFNLPHMLTTDKRCMPNGLDNSFSVVNDTVKKCSMW